VRIVAETERPGVVIRGIAEAEGVPVALLYRWRHLARLGNLGGKGKPSRAKANHAVSERARAASPFTPSPFVLSPKKAGLHRFSFGLVESPVQVEIHHGSDRQVESVTARCGNGSGEIFVRIEGEEARKAPSPLHHVSDELAINGHVLTTRRTPTTLSSASFASARLR
jgi:hypothetical protein